VLNLHQASHKFLSLFPCLTSGEDDQVVDHDWMGDLVDVPVYSRVRVLTGIVFLLCYQPRFFVCGMLFFGLLEI